MYNLITYYNEVKLNSFREPLRFAVWVYEQEFVATSFMDLTLSFDLVAIKHLLEFASQI